MAFRQEELNITIPPKIITEILYRLPAKSIGRFRCVSKAWLSQLTHPDFIKTHLSISSRQNHLIFIIRGIGIYSHPFHSRGLVTEPTKFGLQMTYDDYIATDLYIYGSCNGLVLVRVFYGFVALTVVINPTTREYLELPEHNNESVRVVSLYGFGYDSVTDDYKVVSLTRSADDCVSVYVCSLRNKTWRRVTYCPCYSGRCGVCVNGFIHWMVRTDEDYEDLQCIVAFSLADECLSEVPFPKFCNRLKCYDCKLLVLRGKLAIFIKSKGVVWLMNEYGVRDSWTNILLHGIDKVLIFEPDYVYHPSVFDDNGKIMVANNDRMMVYEVEKAAFTETVCVWDPEIFSIAGFYAESLVSPKQGKEIEGNDDENEEGDDAGVKNVEDDAQVKDENDEDTLEGIRSDLEFSGEGYDSWKAKHREEKLRADKLEEALNHALSNQQFLNQRLEENEATIQSKLVEIQALERRVMEQGRALDTCNDEIESLKARLAVVNEERRKAVALN